MVGDGEEITGGEAEVELVAKALNGAEVFGGEVGEEDLIALAWGGVEFGDEGAPAAFGDGVEVVAIAALEGVVTAAGDEGVVAGSAEEAVVAGTAVEMVGQAAAAEGVVAGQARDPVDGVGVAPQLVVAGGGAAHHQPLPDRSLTPEGAIAKAEGLDSQGGGAEVPDQPKGVAAAEAEQEVAAEPLDGEDLGACPVAEDHLIAVGGIEVLVLDLDAPAPFADAVEVVAGAAKHGVVAAAGNQGVVAGAAVEDVVARAAVEVVSQVASREGVVAAEGRDPVDHVGVAPQLVVAGGGPTHHGAGP